MSDERLDFRVGVRDEFTAPLAKLQAALQRVATNDAAKNIRKDWGEAGRAVEKVAGSFNGFTPLLTGIGAGSLTAASAIGGAVAAIRSFANEGVRLGQVAHFTSQTASEVRAMENALKAFGQTAEQTDAQMIQLRRSADQIIRGTGAAVDLLVSHGLGGDAARLAKARTMKEFDELMMDILRKVRDPVRQQEIAEGIYGDPNRAYIARKTTLEGYREMIAEQKRLLGTVGDEAEKQALRFNQAWSKAGTEFEKTYRDVLLPALEAGAKLLEWNNSGDFVGAAAGAAREAAKGLFKTDPSGKSALEGRRDQVQMQLDALDAGPRGADYARKRERMVEELKRVADELQKLNRANDKAPSVQQQSFGGQPGAWGGGRPMIQTAALGGIYAPGGYGGAGGGGGGGFGGLGQGGGGSGSGGAPGGSGAVPSGSSAGSLTALIDEEAKKAGIDPRIMHGIRAGESHRRGTYDVKHDALESSWGPFQLNRRRGLGVQFEKETGLDVRDPRTIAAQVRWVARFLAKGGSLRHWMGYRGPRSADPRWGNSGYVPDPSATGEGGGTDGTWKTGADGLRVKGGLGGQAFGGGETHSGVLAAAQAIQAAGLSETFTGFNDRFHRGRGFHGAGLAGDFRIPRGMSSVEVERRMHALFGGAGLRQGRDYTVLDEYRNPSPHATGGHMHFNFRSRAAAERFEAHQREQAAAAERSKAPAASRLGDEMMGRRFGARSEQDAVSGGGGKGSLHITMDGFPAGTRARASMDDLFKDVAITQRRQVDSSIKRGPV